MWDLYPLADRVDEENNITMSIRRWREQWERTWAGENALWMLSTLHAAHDARLLAIHPESHLIRAFAPYDVILPYHNKKAYLNEAYPPDKRALQHQWDMCVVENMTAKNFWSTPAPSVLSWPDQGGTSIEDDGGGGGGSESPPKRQKGLSTVTGMAESVDPSSTSSASQLSVITNSFRTTTYGEHNDQPAPISTALPTPSLSTSALEDSTSTPPSPSPPPKTTTTEPNHSATSTPSSSPSVSTSTSTSSSTSSPLATNQDPDPETPPKEIIATALTRKRKLSIDEPYRLDFDSQITPHNAPYFLADVNYELFRSGRAG
jgi:hypothetical protein